MAKFLMQASYTVEGVKGLIKDGGTGRMAALRKAAASVGGKLETFYWTLGKDDAILICDLPDAESAAALSLTIAASGFAHTRTTRLLTAEEMDKAAGKAVKYRPPGK